MTLASAPFYWLTCDAPKCEQRAPDDMAEVVAWESADSARESAQASDWKVGVWGTVVGTISRYDFCPDHALFVCEKCGALDLTPLPGERDYLCVTDRARQEAAEATR